MTVELHKIPPPIKEDYWGLECVESTEEVIMDKDDLIDAYNQIKAKLKRIGVLN